MPTYDYLCDACQHKFELFQGINDSVKKKCPECGKSQLRRLFGTGGAIMFKGSGFYKTDYRSESYKSSAAADKPPSESKEKASGDSKSNTSTGSSSSPATGKSDGKSSSKKKK